MANFPDVLRAMVGDIKSIKKDMSGFEAALESVKTIAEVRPRKGDMGDQGPPGESIKGDPGVPGRDGRDGETVIGPPGESTKGDLGDQGPPGESIRGAKGDPGEPGRSIQGVPGESIKGEKGDKGDQGASVTSVRVQGNDVLVAIDGKEKNVGRFPVPFSPGRGGGSSNTFVDMAMVRTSDVIYAPGRKPTSISVDAVAAPVVINLDDATKSFGIRHEVAKVDASENSVSFEEDGGVPVGALADIALEEQYEVLSFRSDGVEWVVFS